MANYMRLLSSFAFGLLLVRLLLGIGEEAFGLIALLGAGTGIAAAIKEVARASMVPELGAAYHDTPARFTQTYNAAIAFSPLAAGVSVCGFGLLAVLIRWIQIPEELVWAARVFIGAKAIQTFVTICLAPTFNMYMVTERMLAYSAWIVVERLAEVAAAAVVVSALTDWHVADQIIAYATISSGLSVLCMVLPCAMLMRKVSEFRPNLRAATIPASRSLLRSVGWNAGVVLAMNLYIRVDMIIMNLVFGLFGNVVFGIASQMTSYVRLMTMGIVVGVDAVAARLSSDDNSNAVQRLIRQSTKLQAIIVFPSTVALLFLARPIIVFWIGPRISNPETTIPVIAVMVRILIIGIAARSLSEGWMRIMAGAGKTQLYAPTILVAAVANPIVAFLLIYLFHAEYEMLAPAVAFSCLLLVVHLVYVPTVVSRYFEIPLEEVLSPLKRPLAATLVGLVVLVPAARTPIDTVTSLGATLMLFSTVYAVACYAIVLDARERRTIVSIMQSSRLTGVLLRRMRRLELAFAHQAGVGCLMCPMVVEPIAVGLSAIGSTMTGYSRYGLERRIRGLLLSPKYRSVGLRVDRGVQIESPRDVELSDHVTLYGGSHYVAGRSGKIRIGENSHIGRNCVLAGLGGIHIGRGCAISSLVSIYSVSNHFRGDPLQPIVDQCEHSPVAIGNDVWIGAGACILPGVDIGDHAVIGSGAVVNRSVPAWKVAVGVPARVVKDRRDKVQRGHLLGENPSEAA